MKTTKKTLYVWMTRGESESGDNYGPFLFSKKLTAAQLKKFWLDMLEGGDYDSEDPSGPGRWGSYVYISDPEKIAVEDP